MLAALHLVPWLAGCLDVPQVSFAVDASSDVAVASDASDASLEASDGASDVTSADVTADTASDDASDAGTCPGNIPTGAAWCCGSVPCKGTAAACQAECTNCENDCPGQTCCLDKHGNYQGCAANPGACP